MASDKTALVIGASRGIGLGLVKELASRGWQVIGTRRSPASDEGLMAFADQSGGQVRVEEVDIEQPASIEALSQRLQSQVLDLLFVNAGISGNAGPAAGWTSKDAAQVFMTNAVGPIQTAEAFKDRVRDGGVIALMTSGLGSVASDFFFGSGPNLYSASKAALNKMTRAFAAALGERKLTVLSMSPGWVRTDMGGQDAPVSVEDSAKGVIDVVEAKAGSGQHGFYGHDGGVIPW
jgi:NAD(P)-dependent dehydrogenase (short-subunit alcohol dehydrogenase family)